ncbi:MAG: succinylglutamate desuccinylase [Stappia sp.]|nr:succinylglutamate desuccinylase [Stappia sp.]MBM22046.1 succinylglutamate desuccinylase [Stappia sp.]
MENEFPLELKKTDITPYLAGNTGIRGVTTFDSGRAGPHVAITAVVHGNELCGPIALDWLFRNEVRPLTGKLSLAFVNLDAYDLYDEADPFASRWGDEDMNRLWQNETLTDDSTRERRRARELRPFVDTVDLLLDLHSMQNATEALTLSGALEKGRELARAVGVPALVVADKGHAAGKRLRDYGGFGDPSSAKNALLIECGQHWEQSSADVALASSLRFLQATGAVSPDFGADTLAGFGTPSAQRFVEILQPVTIETDAFRFEQDFKGMEVIDKAGTVIGHDGDTPVTAPVDGTVLIMPSRRLDKGMTAVRLGRYLA